MSVELLFRADGLCALVGISLYGLIAQPPLRNWWPSTSGSGVFVLARRAGQHWRGAGLAADPHCRRRC